MSEQRTDGEGSTSPSVAGLAPDAAEDMTLPALQSRLTAIDHEQSRLVCVPVWGWTGDGKTCAVLTAFHYLNPAIHGFSLAYVRDVDELSPLEELDCYRNLRLKETASATKEVVAPLLRQFVDDSDWPAGTDRATTYLFKAQSFGKTLAYALLPDLSGGSFHESDAQARSVLRTAHACMILVNPERYDRSTSEGKEYADAVWSQIQRCAEQGVAAAVLITKSDMYASDAPSVLDDIEKELELIVSQHREDHSAAIRVFRSSVVGTTRDESGFQAAPPPGQERQPEKLLLAWIWLMGRALSQDAEAIRSRVPSVNLASIAASGNPLVLGRRIPELRKVGEFSKAHGKFIAARPAAAGSSCFVSLGPNGDLVEQEFGEDLKTSGATTKALGRLDPWEPAEGELLALCSGAGLLVGARRTTSQLWQGTVGDVLTRGDLPANLTSWAPVDYQRLVALDEQGRLHLLVRRDDKWISVDHVAPAIPASPVSICGFFPKRSVAVVANGSKFDGVMLTDAGRFGERVAVPNAIEFDTTRALFAASGAIAAVRSDNSLVLGAGGHAHVAGEIHAAEGELLFALGNRSPVVAYVDPKLRLRVCLGGREKALATTVVNSALLPNLPDSIVWNDNDDTLAVSFGNGNWGVFKTFALAQHV